MVDLKEKSREEIIREKKEVVLRAAKRRERVETPHGQRAQVHDRRHIP